MCVCVCVCVCVCRERRVCLKGVQKQHVKALAVCLRGTLAVLYFVGNECVCVCLFAQTCQSDSVCYTVIAISIIRVCEKLALGQTIL